jgi:DNA polymerase-3 subunit beta
VLVQVTKEVLLHALYPVLKAVAAHSPLPILSGIHIQADADGLVLTASNSSMAITCRIPQETGILTLQQPGRIVVTARYFYEIVRKLNPGVITLMGEDSFLLTLQSGGTQIRLCGMDPVEFPLPPSVEGQPVFTFRVPNGVLKSAIKQVATVAATSENRPVLTGVCLEYKEASLCLTATDGVRFATCTLRVARVMSSEAVTVVVPGKNLQEAVKLLAGEDGVTEITLTANRIRLQTPTVQIQSAVIDGRYPVLHSIIPRDYRCEIMVDTLILVNAFEIATILASADIVRIVVNAGKMELLSHIAEIGDSVDEIPLQEMNGEDFQLSVNGKYILDILRCLDTESVRMQFTGPLSPLVIQPVNDLTTSLFLITPVRTSH